MSSSPHNTIKLYPCARDPVDAFVYETWCFHDKIPISKLQTRLERKHSLASREIIIDERYISGEQTRYEFEKWHWIDKILLGVFSSNWSCRVWSFSLSRELVLHRNSSIASNIPPLASLSRIEVDLPGGRTRSGVIEIVIGRDAEVLLLRERRGCANRGSQLTMMSRREPLASEPHSRKHWEIRLVDRIALWSPSSCTPRRVFYSAPLFRPLIQLLQRCQPCNLKRLYAGPKFMLSTNLLRKSVIGSRENGIGKIA